MSIKHGYADIDGVALHYVEAGDAGQTMIFLHGFPEYWASWEQQIAFFSERYRVIAFDLPGYNLSGKPTSDAFYQVPNLISFLSKGIKLVSSNEPVILVAHDWGGAIAWPLAAFHSELIHRLVILNAAHPSTFTREMINNPVQRQKSAYIHQLIAQDAHATVSSESFLFLRQMLFDDLRRNPFSTYRKKQYLEAWAQPGAIEGMLKYYRSMPQLAPSDVTQEESGPTRKLAEMKIPQIRIPQPTLVLWGEKDRAFVPELLEGLEEFVVDLEIHRFSDASHWLQHEYPEEVNEAICNFLDSKN